MGYSVSKQQDVRKRATRADIRYQPELDEFLTQCELNFLLLMRFSPELNRVSQVLASGKKGFSETTFTQIHFADSNLKVDIVLTEQTPYTSTLEWRVKTGWQWGDAKADASSHSQRFIARVYHDAKLFEVMGGPQPRALKPRLKQPNRQQKSTDEKRQLNKFLGEILQFMLIAQKVSTDNP